MKQLDLSYVTLTAELLQRALDAQFDADFNEAGSFKKRTVKNKGYWYYKPSAHATGSVKEKYVGPAADEDISSRVQRFAAIKDSYAARRRLVSTLVREARLFSPPPAIGNILEAMWKAGVFRLRACLVGTVAYQNYGSVLGFRLSEAMNTGDIDIAQFQSVSIPVEDSIPPIGDVLKAVDPRFREAPHLHEQEGVTRFISPDLSVEFLTPLLGSDDRAGHPIPLPALGGAAGEPLRFLEYLIHQPIRAVVLYKGGIPVLLPQPARFAVHKLIVSARRRTGEGKDLKNLRQANWLALALRETGRAFEFCEAYKDALERGPKWREAIAQSLNRMASLNMREVEATLQSS